MPTHIATLAIELTDEEKALAARIDFDDAGHTPLVSGSWQHVADAMEELMRSLTKRGAIPKARKKFFTDPDYNVGGHGRSRLQVFERNGTRGVDVFRHGNFVKYLRYFLYGPDLPQSVIEEFQRKVISCGQPFTGSDALDVAHFARGLTRSHSLDTRKAPDEFYKLALDCGLDASDARSVRDSAMQVR
jgi:hypothetical protein